MKRWKDPFPQTPQGFHDRVEDTLRGLEDMDMKQNRSYRKLTIALVAAILALLATGAVAVVTGNSNFKQTLTQSGADKVAELVQEVHLTGEDAQDGFGFSIDEVIWEDENLYMTYSLSVPKDGNYLVALYTPTLNGELMRHESVGFSVPRFYEDDRTVLVFNGDNGFACNDFLAFRVNPILKTRSENALAFRAVLLKTPLSFIGGHDFGEFLNPPEVASLDVSNLLPGDEYGDEYVSLVKAFEAAAGEDGALNLDELVDSGCAEIVGQRELSMNLDASALPQTVYNDVEKHDYDVAGLHLHIDSFRMTHMGIRMKYTISIPEAKSLDENIERLNGFSTDFGYWDFGTIDGKELCALFLDGSGGGGSEELADGGINYWFTIDDRMIIQLDGIQQIVFAPKDYPEDENENQLPPVYDMENAIVLTPTFNEALAAQQAQEAAERQAAVETYAGEDGGKLVYATQNGIWYHTIPHCNGMMNAKAQSVGQAVADGKRPCPLCAGGTDDPPAESHWEELEDISKFPD
ncbi:MAG: hypothetical protein IJ769_05000 [Clostridia bacterium]|nr:hypothetical protein [Clostridia bacterium]